MSEYSGDDTVRKNYLVHQDRLFVAVTCLRDAQTELDAAVERVTGDDSSDDIDAYARFLSVVSTASDALATANVLVCSWILNAAQVAENKGESDD